MIKVEEKNKKDKKEIFTQHQRPTKVTIRNVEIFTLSFFA